MGRAPCCDKANVKKGPWSPEEDAKLKAYIEQFGTGGNWIALPQKIGLKRCGKSCRLRWLNYLRPNIKHGGFSEEEDNIICSLYISIGSRWSIIAAQLPGRTDNDIKNYWNTRLKKKLLGKQQQALARRIHHSLKQEISTSVNKKDDDKNCNILVPAAVSSMMNHHHQTPYFPLPSNTTGGGGRIISELNTVEISQTQVPFFESSNFFQFPDMQFGLVNDNLEDPHPTAEMFHGVVENSCSPPGGEFGDPVLQNFDHDGLVEGCFYGMGSTSAESSSSLGEITSPLVYPHHHHLLSSDFQTHHLPHINNNVAAFAHSRHYCLQ